MKLFLNNWTKIFLLGACFALSIFGFMIKLPSVFRHFDKELHSIFYFSAAAFVNLLFANKKITFHLLIFGVLYLFGVAIEYAQEYSNKLFHKRIHGRYDIEDIQSNLKGLIAFSMLWIIYVAFWFFYKKAKVKKVVNNG
jgi:hypothetical protein